PAHFDDSIYCRSKGTSAQAIKPSCKAQVFPNIQVGIERVVFRQVTDDAFDLLWETRYIEAFDQHVSGCWRKVRGSDLHRGRLTGTVRSKKSYSLPASYIERDVVDRSLSSVDLGKVPDLQRHSPGRTKL